MKHGLTAGAAYRVANRARRNTPRLRLPLTYSQRHGEELGAPVLPQYDKERETILLKLVGAIERQTNRGQTDDNVTRIVAEWAGPLAKYVTLSSVGRAGPARRNGRTDGAVSHRALPTTLRLTVTHSAVSMELRGRLPALKEALKPTGITEVRL